MVMLCAVCKYRGPVTWHVGAVLDMYIVDSFHGFFDGLYTLSRWSFCIIMEKIMCEGGYFNEDKGKTFLQTCDI